MRMPSQAASHLQAEVKEQIQQQAAATFMARCVCWQRYMEIVNMFMLHTHEGGCHPHKSKWRSFWVTSCDVCSQKANSILLLVDCGSLWNRCICVRSYGGMLTKWCKTCLPTFPREDTVIGQVPLLFRIANTNLFPGLSGTMKLSWPS